MTREPDTIYYCTNSTTMPHQVIVPPKVKPPKLCPVATCQAELDKGRKAR